MQYDYLLVKTVLIKGYNVTCSTNKSRDRTNVPNTAVRYYPGTVRHAWEASLGVKGAQIFHLVPASLRNCNTAAHTYRSDRNLWESTSKSRFKQFHFVLSGLGEDYSLKVRTCPRSFWISEKFIFEDSLITKWDINLHEE